MCSNLGQWKHAYTHAECPKIENARHKTGLGILEPIQAQTGGVHKACSKILGLSGLEFVKLDPLTPILYLEGSACYLIRGSNR